MKKTLDFFKFTVSPKDMQRKFLQGFYCDNGYKVATDAKILVMAKADYPAAQENQIVAKDNSFINGHFPAYKSVIPFYYYTCGENYFKEVDTKELLKIKKALKETKELFSVHKKTDSNVYAVIGSQVFSKDMIEKVLHFFECYPDSKLYVRKDNSIDSAYLLQGTSDNVEAACVFMPMQYHFDEISCKCVCINGLYFFKEWTFENISYFLKTYFKKIFDRMELNTLTEKDKKDIEKIKKYFSVMSEKECVEIPEKEKIVETVDNTTKKELAKIEKEVYNKNMKYALSVQNPISYLICMGLKTVENRTWKTEYRGRIYIHSSGGKDFYGLDSDFFPAKLFELEIELENNFKEIGKKLNFNVDSDFIEIMNKLKASDEYSSLAEVYNFSKKWELYTEKLKQFYGYDLYKNDDTEYSEIAAKAAKEKGCYHKNFAIIGHVDLVDIVQDSKSIWAEKNCYHWILENPVLYEKPIINVKGKLRLFDVSHIEMPDD